MKLCTPVSRKVKLCTPETYFQRRWPLPMDERLLRLLLEVLSLETLAAMVADLQEAQEDWQHYPAEAPDETRREVLVHGAAIITEIGQAQAPNFQKLVEQAQAQKAEGTWVSERDRQEVQNWLSDFD